MRICRTYKNIYKSYIMSKIIILFFLLLSLCGCNTKIKETSMNAFFSELIDTKPCTDSINLENMEFCVFNKRRIVLKFLIHNNLGKDIYLPIRSFFGGYTDTVNTNIKVYFVNGKDTLFPYCSIGRIPSRETIIYKGDSIRLKIEIGCFQEWGNEEVGVKTDIRTLISKLHLEYCKSSDDIYENYDPPIIKFDTIPNVYYEVQRGGTLEPYLGPLCKVKF